MKVHLILSALLLTMVHSFSGQVKIPDASPAATISQMIGFTNVTIEYNRPLLKGRDMYVDLTREGEVWRTGANMATRLTLSDDLTIQGKLVPKGKYSLYSIRTGDEWTLIINKKISWGTTYDQKEDFLRIKVPTRSSSIESENHTFYFDNVSDDSGTLGFKWGTSKIEFKLKVDIHEKVIANIKQVMKDEDKATDQDFYNAGNYYLRKKLDKDKVLHWAQVYVDQRKNNKLHWQLAFKGNALIYAGKKDEALPIFKLALKKAKETNKDDAVHNYTKKIANWNN